MMPTLKQIYRAVVPTRTRTRVMHWRELGAAFALRELAYDLRRGLGWNRPVVRAPHGCFRLDLRDTIIARRLYLHGEFEPTECAYLASVLKPGMVVYDIGANLGYHTVLAARLVGPAGRVICFEPDPANYSLLTENIRLNRLTNVTSFNCALGATTGSLEMHTSDSNFGDHRMYETQGEAGRRKHTVRIECLDELVRAEHLPLPDFVKLDVQGYEGRVLDGAINTISAERDLAILLEYWPHGMKMAGSTDPNRFIRSLLAAHWTGEELGWVGQLPGAGAERRPLDWDRLQTELRDREQINPEGAFIDLAFCSPAWDRAARSGDALPLEPQPQAS